MKFYNNIHIIIGLIVILLIICILYYQTKKTTDYFYFSDITPQIETAIETDLVNCFNITVNDRFQLVNYLNSEFVNKNETELISKIKDLAIPGLIMMVRFIRLYSLDFFCKNEPTNAKIVHLSDLFFKQIKSLINYHHAIFRVGNYNIGTLNINDDLLFKEIVCLTKSKLLLTDQNILKDYDSIEYPDSISAQLLNTYPLYIYTQEIYNLIIKYAKKESTNHCNGVSLNDPKSLIPVYRMHPEGNVKQCNERNYPVPIPTSPSGTSTTQTNRLTADRIAMKDTIFSTYDTVKAPIYSASTKMYMSTSLTNSTTSVSSVFNSTSQQKSTTTTTTTPPPVSSYYGISGMFTDQSDPGYLLSTDLGFETISEEELEEQQRQQQLLLQQRRPQNNNSVLSMIQNSNYIDPMSDTNILEAGSGTDYIQLNSANGTKAKRFPKDRSLSSAFYIPSGSQPKQTVFPFDTTQNEEENKNQTRRRNPNGGTHNFKSYVEFPSYKNINLENDTGSNNFFLPNIFIET
jgi:hypothetical protein